MSPTSAVLRVKRKRGTDAADALLLACKRIRPESASQSAGESEPEPKEGEIESSVFKLVATVSSQDAPVEPHVREALSRPRQVHALRPSAGSANRITGALRSAKWSARREERYRILSGHRAGLALAAEPDVPSEQGRDACSRKEKPADAGEPVSVQDVLGDLQVFDIVHEDGGPAAETVTSGPEDILCNSVKMIRKTLSISENGAGAEHREKEDDYVYDLYYQEGSSLGWIQDILSVKPYLQESELVPDDDPGDEEVYEDEDDENEEDNWRNDYPDEENSDDSDPEEGYMGYRDESVGQRSWERYRREVLQEFDDYDDEEYLDSD